MADVEQMLYAHLAANSGVSTLVGTRIFPVQRGQGSSLKVLPAITYQRISTNRFRDLNGPTGLITPRVQVVCWSATYAGAKALADAVRLAVDDVTGTTQGLYIGDMFVEDQGEMPFDTGDQEERAVYGERLDLIVWHNETVPS